MGYFKKIIKKSNEQANNFNIAHLDMMCDVLSYFNLIDLNNELNMVFVRYFIKRANEARNINIREIENDLLNGVDAYTIALKYFQPLCVIEDIKNGNYDLDKNLIHSKLYVLRDVISNGDIDSIKRNNLIEFKESEDYVKFFTDGKTILNSLDKVKQVAHGNVVGGNVYINLKKAAEMLWGDDYTVGMMWRIKTKNIYGVKIKTTKNIKGVVYNKEDILRAKENSINYIFNKDVKKKLDLEQYKRNRLYTPFKLFKINTYDDTDMITKQTAIDVIELSHKVKERDHIGYTKYILKMLKEYNLKYCFINEIIFKYIFYVNSSYTLKAIEEKSIFGIKLPNNVWKTNSIKTSLLIEIIEESLKYGLIKHINKYANPNLRRKEKDNFKKYIIGRVLIRKDKVKEYCKAVNCDYVKVKKYYT